MAAKLNGDVNSPATATASGGTLTITSKGTQQLSLSWSNLGSSFVIANNGPIVLGLTSLANSPVATSYVYDVLGNITSVVQGGQTRTYAYDGLGRTISVSTPESGTSYLYYTTASGTLCSGNASDVCRVTNARGNTTTLAYDTANRLISKTHSDSSTGAISYAYDSGGASGFTLGRLTKMTDSTGSEAFTYDSMGQVTKLTKTIGSLSYPLTYTYNAGGQLTSLTYPSGRKVQYAYDNVGHLCAVAASATSCGSYSTPYATGFSYDADGRSTQFTYGNGINANFSFDPKSTLLSSLSYSNGTQTLFGLGYWYQKDPTNCGMGNPVGNNGQVQCITDAVDAGRNAAYQYDILGRLGAAVTAGASKHPNTSYPQWGVSESYDRFGNRPNQSVIAGSGPSVSVSINAATNQLQGGYTYDLDGHLTGEPAPTAKTYSYDTENCLKSFSYPSMSISAAYACDGNGLRVTKSVTPGTNTVYVFSGEKVVAEYDGGAAVTSPTREFIYGEGDQLLATAAGGATTFQHFDHLSARLSTNSSGAVVGQQGHFPFGEPWYKTGTTTNWFFSDYERDQESGLDYAQARTYSSTFGRFMSGDPLGGTPTHPQSWNRYAYAGNDPINSSDPTGADDGFDCCDFGANLAYWGSLDDISSFAYQWTPLFPDPGFDGSLSTPQLGYMGVARGIDNVGLGFVLTWLQPQTVVHGMIQNAKYNYNLVATKEGRKALVEALGNRQIMVPLIAETTVGLGAGFIGPRGVGGEPTVALGIPKEGMLMETGIIGFTQDDIGMTFRDGRPVQGLIDELRAGKSPNEVEPTKVFQRNGMLDSLDNRRLFAHHQAGSPIRVVPATQAEIDAAIKAGKFTGVNRQFIGLRPPKPGK